MIESQSHAINIYSAFPTIVVTLADALRKNVGIYVYKHVYGPQLASVSVTDQSVERREKGNWEEFHEFCDCFEFGG